MLTPCSKSNGEWYSSRGSMFTARSVLLAGATTTSLTPPLPKQSQPSADCLHVIRARAGRLCVSLFTASWPLLVCVRQKHTQCPSVCEYMGGGSVLAFRWSEGQNESTEKLVFHFLFLQQAKTPSPPFLLLISYLSFQAVVAAGTHTHTHLSSSL